MNIDSLVARWRQFEKTLAERDLSWGLHYAPAHLRWARRAGHPRGAELGHLLPDDYRAFVAAVGYPVVGFSYYDAQGLSMLPPEPMAVISVELPGPDDDWPEPDPVAPTRCRYAFFAGSELSDIEGFAFGAAEDGGPPLVWLVEGGMAREPIAPFADWLTGELARLEERIAHVDAQTATAWREENAGETDPHRLLDYALDGSYELPPFAVADLELAWVEEQSGSPYSYGLIDAAGQWRIPMGKRFKSVRPFRAGVAEVILEGPGSTYAGPWTRIHPDGSPVTVVDGAGPPPGKG